MNFRTLGDSDVEVSEVGFGAWVVGTDWWGDRTREDAIDLIHHAIDEGITYFDTGDVYGHGDSEELLGEALADHREDVTVATKIGYDFYNHPQAGHGELPKEITGEWVRTATERSLDRLDMEHVDVLQLHNANVDEVDADVLEALDELKEEGLVRAVGWALGPSIGWLAEGDLAIREEFDSVQLVWNLFEQEVGNHFLDTIAETGSSTSLIPRVPHSSGLLNEQVTPETGHDLDDHRGFRPDAWYETGWEKLDALRFLERKDEGNSSGFQTESETSSERTMAQAAIAYLLSHEDVATVTPTFHTKDDITAWAAASEVPTLSDDELARVAELYDTNFGIDRDDGMDELRSSVGGDDIREAEINKRATAGPRDSASSD